jgi:hypothetical protein
MLCVSVRVESALSSLSARVRDDACEAASVRYAACTRRFLEAFTGTGGMSEFAAASPEIELDGTLRWNEFEGGFWSLDLDAPHPELGSRVVLTEFTPPAAAVDGSRIRAHVRAREAQFGFQMAGVYVDVIDAELR